MKLHIKGMTCGHCKMKVEEQLATLEQVDHVEVDLIEGTADLSIHGDLHKENIVAILKEAGYELSNIEP